MLRNESPSRQDEGLPQYTEVVKGNVEQGMTIRVGPLRFLVDLMTGQKTGFYFDQRENRLLTKEFAAGATVLDCFSYTCAFGLYALHFGARSATFVDSSAKALELGRENMRINRLSGGEFIRGDVFEFLKASDREYDLMILDPPSFIKSRKKVKEGEKGYIDLHKKALRRLARWRSSLHLFLLPPHEEAEVPGCNENSGLRQGRCLPSPRAFPMPGPSRAAHYPGDRIFERIDHKGSKTIGQ